jgi:hypothetical protein
MPETNAAGYRHGRHFTSYRTVGDPGISRGLQIDLGPGFACELGDRRRVNAGRRRVPHLAGELARRVGVPDVVEHLDTASKLAG